MNTFKIGDKVVGTHVDFNCGVACPGMITRVDNSDKYLPYFVTSDDTALYGWWFQPDALRAAAGTPPDVTAPAHTFAVGDKGKTRDGSPYEVLALVPNRSMPLVLEISGLLFECSLTGKRDEPRDVWSDLIAPVKTRTLFINVYPTTSCNHDTAEQAREWAAGDVLVVAHEVTITLP